MTTFLPEDNSFNVTDFCNQLETLNKENQTLNYKGADITYSEGKVRNIYQVPKYNIVIFEHSDRLSAYDSNICDIKYKGLFLNITNNWWMNNTRHIIDNHLLLAQGKYLIGKLCNPIKLEIIVRGYITGSSPTSLWTLYQENKHGVYGVELPSNLKKNQKLENPIITPTTKGDVDIPLSGEKIVNDGYLEESQWNFIKEKAIELFTFGSNVANSKGLILVDTKYEFGIDNKGNIILIDECHTCDSSRYWKLHSYQQKFQNGEDPENFDKEQVRKYINKLNPEFKKTPLDKRTIPIVDDITKSAVLKAYSDIYYTLTGNNNSYGSNLDDSNNNLNNITLEQCVSNYFDNLAPLVLVLAGSRSDIEVVKQLNDILDKEGLPYHNYFHSAHKETQLVVNLIQYYEKLYGFRKIVYITIVGKSNALGGVLAANTKFPVINCPNFKSDADMIINLNSSIQMPSKVPVATILNKENAVLFAKKVFNL
tara:strand:- start:904 stop:2346 length:1443 start_codon:yes stop_codon:yes gene_type:complete